SSAYRRSHLRRSALLGDLELEAGMDHVRVVSDRILVRGIELGPALRVAHLGLRDVGKRVARLDRVGLGRTRVLAAALALALLQDAVGLAGLICRGLVDRRTAFATWHVTPPSPTHTAYRRPRLARAPMSGNSSQRPRV